MFLNIRMLIVALFASIVALSCELGVFAAFGGSHQPLMHMPTDTGSLQLVSTDGGFAPTRSWGAPFGAGVPPDKINSERTAADAPRLTPVRDGAVDLLHAWAASPVSPGATFVAPVAHASRKRCASPIARRGGALRPQNASPATSRHRQGAFLFADDPP